MKRTIRALLLALVLGLVADPRLAAAHPLGNFSVNRYSRVELGPAQARLRYVLDLAEIPTLQELKAAGVEGVAPDAATRQRLLETKVRTLAAGARLELDNRAVPWKVEEAALDLLPGQADLPTMRVSLSLVAPVEPTDGAGLSYSDTNYPGRAGWREVVLRGSDGVALADSTVPSQDSSDELRRYPDDPTLAPLDVASATATVQLAAAMQAAPSPANPAYVGAPRLGGDAAADRLTALLRAGSGADSATLLLMLAVAAGLGAMHALGPGHGKTVVGAYLVGSRGTARHAAFLGLTVTLTHTIGVYALGLVTLVAAEYVLPERLYPLLGALSGLLVVGIGLSLVRSRLASALEHPAKYEGGRHEHSHQRHDHGSHQHEHGHHRHDHAAHHHEHDGIPHEHRTDGLHPHGGGKPHRHLPPGAQGERVTLKSLLALGVSGGLLPCPSALVVLLAAISFHNVLLGMALVAAFSVGLAAVLTAIGLLMVYGGRWLGRSPLAGRLAGAPLARAVPALSAVAITIAGLAITVQSARVLL